MWETRDIGPGPFECLLLVFVISSQCCMTADHTNKTLESILRSCLTKYIPENGIQITQTSFFLRQIYSGGDTHSE